MTGSLQEKHGVWYAVQGTCVDGKRKQKWISTQLSTKGNNKCRAQNAPGRLLVEYEEIQRRQQKRALQPQSALLEPPYFHEHLEEWLKAKKDKIELSTWESYEVYVTTHLVPWFKELDLRINEVSPRHVKQYLEHKFRGGRADGQEKGLSIASLKKHKSVKVMAFREALIEELVDRNPAESVPLPKRDDSESKAVFLTAEEANQVLEAFRGHELQPIVYITLYYGLRKSEVLGLKWDAVDLEKDTLRIQHTVVKHKQIVAKDRTKSKTGNGSAYELLPEVKELLLQLKAEQEENRRVFGRAWQDTGYIFVHPDGSPRRPDCITRGFQRVLANHGLKRMRFHDLRHPCVKHRHKSFKLFEQLPFSNDNCSDSSNNVLLRFPFLL